MKMFRVTTKAPHNGYAPTSATRRSHIFAHSMRLCSNVFSLTWHSLPWSRCESSSWSATDENKFSALRIVIGERKALAFAAKVFRWSALSVYIFYWKAAIHGVHYSCNTSTTTSAGRRISLLVWMLESLRKWGSANIGCPTKRPLLPTKTLSGAAHYLFVRQKGGS